MEKQKEKILTGLTKELGNVFQSHVRNNRNHVFRHEPEAQFVSELAQEDPYSAAVALDYLLNGKSQDSKAYAQFRGKLLGALFRLNIHRTVSPDIEAFKEASRTWSTELGTFRERYETLAADYEALKQSNQGTTKAWADKTVEMQGSFKEQLQKQQQDLENLKETYESHMVLKGPMLYWRQKRKEHDRQIKTLRKQIIFWSILGAIVLFGAAYLLLPQFHPSNSIPWRQIGFFILASTFTLWFIRLLVKLLLSNIHLSADAREREVMIQTFMAMMRHKESREGVKKEDIALVLAPIFKPSTTGVIKDEGGPITLTDFASRMASK